eukprot:TCONS_00073761-protein
MNLFSSCILLVFSLSVYCVQCYAVKDESNKNDTAVMSSVEIPNKNCTTDQKSFDDFKINIQRQVMSQNGRIETLEIDLNSIKKKLKCNGCPEKKILNIENATNIHILKDTISEQRQRIELLENELDTLKQESDSCNNKNTSLPSFLSKTDKLIWGAKKFFKGEEMEFDLYGSYQHWYSNITKIMRNKVQYQSKDFVFIRKDMERHFTEEYSKGFWKSIYFVSKRKNSHYPEGMSTLIVEGIGIQQWEKGVFLLLHPTSFEKCLEFDRYSRDDSGEDERWKVDEQTPDYYWGDNKSVIIFGILNKNNA